ncbi:DsbE family thiol:disulfide interchange protein [Telmatospirillum sp. J64-1]|uniref:DsbE family thiol:disulfide interchange protein n=1 Tax=Telmatospirillum sp. J64-1 TaxID=2502183 RepID=UPI00115D6B94|nr:DsbE family thiol:disulfide interchange protein [Telmatospirillum sp. J64-1]
MRRILYLLPVLIFLVVAGFFFKGLFMDPSEVPSPLISQPAPDFDLPPLNPEKPGFRTADMQGRVTLVNFFASWCIPCRVEHPLFMELAAQHADEVQLVGISYKDKPEDSLSWLSRLGDPYARIGHDETTRVAIDWGVYGVPETYLVDPQGIIRYKHVGPIDRHTMDNTILPMIRDLSKPVS